MRNSLLSWSKRATLGGDPESSFESSFASLAYSFVADKAPRLLDYLAGFQLVDRDNDNTRAMGVFGFRLGDSWAYVPVFFLSGNLKGHELLYLKDQDLFVPLKENWINHVLSRKQQPLGRGVPQTATQLGIRQPDLRRLSMPPHNFKYSSHDEPAWLADFLPVLGHLFTADPCQHEKFAGLDTRVSLPALASRYFSVCKQAAIACSLYPGIQELCERHYGEGWLMKAAVQLRQGLLRSPLLQEQQPVKQAAGEKVKIHVPEDEVFSENVPELDEADREKLLREGYLIEDHREGDEVSKVYNMQIEMTLQNPQESGLHEVLSAEGQFDRCLVLSSPHGGQGRMDGITVLRLSPKKYLNAARTAIFTRPAHATREDFSHWYDEQSSVESLSEDHVYLAVSRGGEGSTPFRVQERVGEGRYRVSFQDYLSRRHGDPFPALRPVSGHSDDPLEASGPEMVEINQRKGTSFRSSRGTLYVPVEAKLILVKSPRREEGYDCPAEESEDSSFEPGNLIDLQMQILAKTAKLKVSCDAHEASINNGPCLSKRAALFALVREHHLRESAAREVIKQAEQCCLHGRAARFLIKYAANPYAQTTGPGPGGGYFEDPPPGFDPQFGNVQVQEPSLYYQQIPELMASQTDPAIYDPRPEATPDPMAMQSAQQAGQLGQKEVFDTSMFTGLLRGMGQDSLNNNDLGDLIKALDRLGRRLFVFYYHNDDFADRYGKSELPELEDSLRNTFEQLGDLVLFLQERNLDLFNLDRGPSVSDTGD